jgi:AAA domain
MAETQFGFNYYPAQYTGKPVYFQPGDPNVDYEQPYKGYQDRIFGGWHDRRDSKQRDADQLAAITAKTKWEAQQQAQAAIERQQHEREVAEEKRVAGWKKLFHSKEELENAPPLTFAIEGFLQEKGITMIGGKSGDGKTLIAMEMAKCLIEGTPLFGHFNVHKPATRIIYLIPESGIGPLRHRTDLFGLTQHAGDKFFSRSLDITDPNLSITDPAILKACEGADVFLDTAVRFMEGDENAAADSKRFADNLFALLRAGARTVTGLHHAPKAFSTAQHMSLENILRGSGDIGAMLASCWGIAQVDCATTSIYVEQVKARDGERCKPFKIAGRPSINETGHFVMTATPGMAGDYQQQRASNGRPKTDNAVIVQAWLLSRSGKSHREIAAQLKVGKSTVSDWLAGKCPDVLN